ncbi:hypothetical protein DFH08DRAFT_808341 [Mycena albidolilacea]|uniref:Uncharacterized protein n=1 Tax=Mycena albidolilacea TaxID=1033008 RepID=A0AAD7ESI8_9AGAR|nr:hypothetical protein DFH08DRAFT_808341 [Mycena albidolilacea]
MVTGLFPGQTEALRFRRPHLKCNGVWSCEFIDPSLFSGCGCYEPDAAAVRELGSMNLMQAKEVLSWPAKITSYHGKKDLKMKIWGLQTTQSGTITHYFNKRKPNGTGTEMVGRLVCATKSYLGAYTYEYCLSKCGTAEQLGSALRPRVKAVIPSDGKSQSLRRIPLFQSMGVGLGTINGTAQKCNIQLNRLGGFCSGTVRQYSLLFELVWFWALL